MDDFLVERIRSVMKPGSTLDDEVFNDLALKLGSEHGRFNPAYEYWTPNHWTEIKCMPISRFKTFDKGFVGLKGLSQDGSETVFRSSGTTSQDRSSHILPHTDLYEASIAGSFLHLVLRESRWIPGYVLVTVSPHIKESSLCYMMDYLRDQLGVVSLAVDPSNQEDLDSLQVVLEDAVDLDTPVIMFGTALALYDLSEAPIPRGLLQLHPQSRIITTGGWKGRSVNISLEEMEDRFKTSLGLEQHNMMREYSMSELSSQMYGYASEIPEYKSMPWLRYQVVDPLTQKRVKDGEHGAIAFYDLANAYSMPFVLTEDEGSIGPNGGLILYGRLEGSVEKGCSLTYEQSKT